MQHTSAAHPCNVPSAERHFFLLFCEQRHIWKDHVANQDTQCLPTPLG